MHAYACCACCMVVLYKHVSMLKVNIICLYICIYSLFCAAYSYLATYSLLCLNLLCLYQYSFYFAYPVSLGYSYMPTYSILCLNPAAYRPCRGCPMKSLPHSLHCLLITPCLFTMRFLCSINTLPSSLI